MFASYALSIARRSRGFIAGSAPPRRAATVTSLMSRVKILPFLASAAAFLCLTLAHLECPAMAEPRIRVGKLIILSFAPCAKPRQSGHDRTFARRQIEKRGALAPACARQSPRSYRGSDRHRQDGHTADARGGLLAHRRPGVHGGRER